MKKKSAVAWFRAVREALARRGVVSELDLTSGVVWIPRQPDYDSERPLLGLSDESLVFYRDNSALEGEGDELLVDFGGEDPEEYDGITTSVARAVASVTDARLRRAAVPGFVGK